MTRSIRSNTPLLAEKSERMMLCQNSRRTAYRIANELKYTSVRSLLLRRKRNRAIAASPIDSKTNPMAAPATSQRNSERADAVMSMASAKGRGICPRLYVVRAGKANAKRRESLGDRENRAEGPTTQ